MANEYIVLPAEGSHNEKMAKVKESIEELYGIEVISDLNVHSSSLYGSIYFRRGDHHPLQEGSLVQLAVGKFFLWSPRDNQEVGRPRPAA